MNTLVTWQQSEAVCVDKVITKSQCTCSWRHQAILIVRSRSLVPRKLNFHFLCVILRLTAAAVCSEQMPHRRLVSG